MPKAMNLEYCWPMFRTGWVCIECFGIHPLARGFLTQSGSRCSSMPQYGSNRLAQRALIGGRRQEAGGSTNTKLQQLPQFGLKVCSIYIHWYHRATHATDHCSNPTFHCHPLATTHLACVIEAQSSSWIDTQGAKQNGTPRSSVSTPARNSGSTPGNQRCFS